MFSANFQLVPTIILILNWFNIESTIFAYVNFVKRPIAIPKKGIGLWNDILLVVGYIATVINCLSIYRAN
jgi:anoctamin-10